MGYSKKITLALYFCFLFANLLLLLPLSFAVVAVVAVVAVLAVVDVVFCESQCHYNATTSVCEGGPPTTCNSYYNDTVGCPTANCIVQTYANNQCAPKCNLLAPQECVGLVPIRQDCRLNYTSSPKQCYSSTDNIDNCSNAVNQATCNPATCVFDQYEQNCFTSLTQVNTVFSCQWWADNFPSNSGACQYHGCIQTPSGSCISAVVTGNTLDNSTSVNYAQQVQVCL